jgi:hypothetical protein
MNARGVFRVAALTAALAGTACGGASRESESEPEPAEWSASRVRGQWPAFEFGEPSAPACLTVWVVRGDGCAVSDETGTPVTCVSAVDPLVLNADPDRFGTCIVEVEDCAAVRCHA